MSNETTKIPQATAKRLPLYYRFLKNLHSSGKQRVSSAELSEAVKVDSATIRRDFSYFGALGKKGYGYNVNYLISFFRKTLDQDELTRVALIGVGNLGTAFLNYNFLKNNNTKIECAFDVDPEKMGTMIREVPVYHMDDLEKVLSDSNIFSCHLNGSCACRSNDNRSTCECEYERDIKFHSSKVKCPAINKGPSY